MGVHTRSGGVWSQQGSKLAGTGAVSNANEGRSVALSADGNTAIVGGVGDNSQVGASWVLRAAARCGVSKGSKLVGTGAVGNASQGASVSLSGDGNTAIVGGPSDDGSAGATWVYTRSGRVWSQQGGKRVGAGAVGGAAREPPSRCPWMATPRSWAGPVTTLAREPHGCSSIPPSWRSGPQSDFAAGRCRVCAPDPQSSVKLS